MAKDLKKAGNFKAFPTEPHVVPFLPQSVLHGLPADNYLFLLHFLLGLGVANTNHSATDKNPRIWKQTSGNGRNSFQKNAIFSGIGRK
ncbi:MAG: hypothetical protein QNI90_03145 [Dinoroseobacter sp.]|nr:hypothetical protein [Dinoroseobacter sp.]